MATPFISICIPTYNRTKYLPRLLDSIINQSFINYNIIVTDNSEDDRIEKLLDRYRERLPIKYHKNVPALNMAGNWNKSFELADGEWIKLMHDDDWFASNTALQKFADATKSGRRFIYCGRFDFYEENSALKEQVLSNNEFLKIKQNPPLLYAKNSIGPPSLLMFHSSVNELYDPTLQWFVDIEYYIRMLQKEDAVYIHEPLVNINYGNLQVTTYSFNNPKIQIPEILYVAKTYGLGNIKSSIVMYDGFWRMMRNLGIRTNADFSRYAADMEIPDVLKKIVTDQSYIPKRLLKIGVISKLAMAVSYIL